MSDDSSNEEVRGKPRSISVEYAKSGRSTC